MSFAGPLGSHVPRKTPLVAAADMGADVIQLNLSAPRNWDPPKQHGDEQTLAESNFPIFVHAPYLVNPSSIKPESRRQSRVCLEAECAAAARIGAHGLVVHGGHPTGDGTVDDAIENWLDTLDGATLACRILIENTAGGENSPARDATTLTRLVTTLRDAGHDIGVTFDTCHAWASGQHPDAMARQLVEAFGVIDLVHANNSRDLFGSRRDRHANLTAGHIPPQQLVDAVRAANAPTVVETPGGTTAQSADVAWLRETITKSL